ncbi:MAG: hypothetical protein KAR19_11205 [Bacteroidales bacterium]|nr:hypothetical protein [Bacteroidales bacterium]
MNRIVLIFVSILLMSWGCDIKNPGYYNSDWARISKDFNDSLLAHFPQNVKGSYYFTTTFPIKCKESNRCGVILAIPTNSKSYRSHIPSFITSTIEYKDSDPSVVIINGQKSIEIEQGCGDSLKIIPNIKRLITECKTCSEIGNEQLSEFSYYLIDTQSGRFIKEEYLSEREDLPQLWKNGFSKGIAINQSKTLVIYWLEIW